MEVVEFIDKNRVKVIQFNEAFVGLLQQRNENALYSFKFLEKPRGSGRIHTTFRIWRLAKRSDR
jgi:hypothetical protein